MPAERAVRRFDVHQRIQHAMLASSFVGLVLTGWPMRSHESGVSRALLETFGGIERAATAHRFFGALLCIMSIYHLVYVLVIARRGQLSLAMIPSFTDVQEVFENVFYMVGLRARPPRFGKYAYWEKFDYWAVFWGMGIIGASGLVLWFPVLASKLLPGWSLPIAQLLHGDEALLALLAIFIWHFYNGHFRDVYFPMNWAFITGTLPESVVREEYGRWHDELARAGAATPAPEPAAEHPVGSVGALWRLAFTGFATALVLGVIAIVVAKGPDPGYLARNAPVGTLGGGWGPAHAAAAERPEAAPAHASLPVTATAALAPELRSLAGVPFDSMADASKLACFKTCHSLERFTDGRKVDPRVAAPVALVPGTPPKPFPHGTHAGKGVDCAACHEFAAHVRSEVKKEACKDCHE